MYARRHRPLRLRVGQLLELADATDDDATLRQVRRTLYALGKRRAAAATGPEPLAAAVEPRALWMAVEATELLGQTSDGKQIRLAQCAADSTLLRAIGRLRQLTFRQVGPRPGRSRNLAAFDPPTQHTVAWDAAARRL